MFEQVYERIKKATGKETQVEIAEILGIRQSSISDAKKRNRIPADWVLTLHQKLRINPDWLLHGTGSILVTAWEVADDADKEIVQTIQQSLIMLKESLAQAKEQYAFIDAQLRRIKLQRRMK